MLLTPSTDCEESQHHCPFEYKTMWIAIILWNGWHNNAVERLYVVALLKNIVSHFPLISNVWVLINSLVEAYLCIQSALIDKGEAYIEHHYNMSGVVWPLLINCADTIQSLGTYSKLVPTAASKHHQGLILGSVISKKYAKSVRRQSMRNQKTSLKSVRRHGHWAKKCLSATCFYFNLSEITSLVWIDWPLKPNYFTLPKMK